MNYFKPENIDEVCALLSEKGNNARVIAGGTDLLVESRYKKLAIQNLIDISQIPGLNDIYEEDNKIIIGVTATHDKIVNDPLINKHAPLLAEACRQIGSQQIRNRGTIGGNICNASPCADSIPPLFTLNAVLKIKSTNSETKIPISDFFSAPYHTKLTSDEWLTHIIIDKLEANYRSSFIKLGRRNALAISRINMATILKLSTNRILEARFSPGSVFPVWSRIDDVEKMLKDQDVSVELFEDAGQLVSKKMIEVSGIRWSTPYKEPVVAALTKRALCKAAGLENGES